MCIRDRYSNFKYARRLGIADSDFGKFELRNKNFKGDSFILHYGSRTHNLKVSGELSLELNPGREFYVRGTYLMPFHHRQIIWIKERKQIFRRDRRVNVSDDQINVLQNDTPGANDLIPDPTFSISVGILFK